MILVACYAIIVGLAMIGMWIVSVLKRQVPELADEPVRIGFHLAGEFMTAIALLIGGSALLVDTSWAEGVSLASMGMLLYTVVVSPGYFGQKGHWPMVGFFAILVVLTLVSTAWLIVDIA
jgi:hypothetical protein